MLAFTTEVQNKDFAMFRCQYGDSTEDLKGVG